MIKKNVISSLLANSLGLILVSAFQLISVPILIKYWGVDYYGEWIVIFSMPSYLGLSDLGLGTATSTQITMHLAKGEDYYSNEIFNSVFFFIQLIGLAVLSVFLIIFSFFSLTDWFSIQLIPPWQFNFIFLALLFYVFLSLLLTLPLGLYRSVDAYARGQYVSYFFRSLEFVAFIIVVVLGGAALSVACCFLAIRLLQVFFVIYDIKRLASWLEFQKPKINRKIISSMLGPSLSLTSVTFGQALTGQGMLILVGTKLGSKSVVVFSTIRTLINLSKQLINNINLSFWGEFSKSFANANLELCKKLHVRSVQLILITATCAALFLWAFSDYILYFWTNGKVVGEEPFFSLFLACIIFDSLWYASWSMLMAINHHQKTTLHFLFFSLFSLMSSFVLMPILGLSAIPISVLLFDIIMMCLVIPKAFIIIEENYNDFFKKIGRFK